MAVAVAETVAETVAVAVAVLSSTTMVMRGMTGVAWEKERCDNVVVVVSQGWS